MLIYLWNIFKGPISEIKIKVDRQKYRLKFIYQIISNFKFKVKKKPKDKNRLHNDIMKNIFIFFFVLFHLIQITIIK